MKVLREFFVRNYFWTFAEFNESGAVAIYHCESFTEMTTNSMEEALLLVDSLMKIIDAIDGIPHE